MRVRPQRLDEADQRVDIVVIAERACLQRDVAGIVPVGDVDVVVAQQRRHRVAQQRREMARHRRHDQHLGLRRVAVLAEAKQAAEGEGEHHLLGHRHVAIALAHALDVVGRAFMGQARPRHHLVSRRRRAPVYRLAAHRPRADRRQGGLRQHPGRIQQIRLGLIGEIEHRDAPLLNSPAGRNRHSPAAGRAPLDVALQKRVSARLF